MKKLHRNIIVIFLLSLGFLIIAETFLDKRAEELIVERTNLQDLSEESQIDKVSFPQPTSLQLSTQPSSRELKEYYSRRQFYGAPPTIPHPINVEEGDNNCASCHKSGGYVAKFNAYTPVTPHPNFVVCQQCHVPDSNLKAFKGEGIKWTSVSPPMIKRTAIPGGPPPIPLSTQLRENCLACHSGPGAVKEIRTPHPERVNCTECHVIQNNVENWTRK